MVTIQLISNHLVTILFILFAYLIPLLSSIRTVYNQDHETFKFWTTYWFLLYFLTPIVSIFKVSRYIQLVFVMWLSLPRFQGALFVYHQLFEPVMEKYNLEQKVDKKIQGVYNHVRLISWKIMTDLGWSVLGQVGEWMSWMKGTTSADESLCEDEGKEEEKACRHVQGTKSNKSNDSFPSIFKRKPSYSIMDSLSNHSSMDSASDLIGTDMYKHDFINILKQGLYVFAHTGEMPKRFRLRILYYSYECIDDEQGTDDKPKEKECFVLERVDTNAVDDGEESITLIPFHTISSVQQSGSHSIKLMSDSQSCTSLKEDEVVVLTEIVLSDEQDQQTFLQGLYACLPHVTLHSNSMESFTTTQPSTTSSDQSL